MKKTYINPTLYIKGVRPNNILAGSPTIQSDDTAVTTDGENSGANVGGTNYGNNGDGLAKDSWGAEW